MPRYILMLRDLIINENDDHRYYQLLWFVQSAVLSNFTEKGDLQLQNWSSALSFYFDRLLTKTDRLSIMEVLQHYRNNKNCIDASFQSSMTAFISELQGDRPFIAFEERDFDRKLSNLSVAELKAAAYQVSRLSECKAQYLLTILFHLRIVETFGGQRSESAYDNKQTEDVTVNLQSVVGFSYLSSQPLLNHPHSVGNDPKSCRSLLSCFDEISVAVSPVHPGRHDPPPGQSRHQQ